MKLLNHVRGLRVVGEMALAGAGLAGASGCASQVSTVNDPVAHAQTVLPILCGDVSAAERAAVVLARQDLIGVEPAEGVRRPSDGFPRGFPKGVRAPELEGATLQFAAARGVTPAWLERQLQCHQSEVVLGRAPLTESDPYVLPHEWLEIRVKAQGSALVVETRAGTRNSAEAALERALRFRGVDRGAEPRVSSAGDNREVVAELGKQSQTAGQ